MLAPAVMALRMPLLLAELALPPRERHETTGAITEKLIAAQVGLWSATLAFSVRAAWLPYDMVSGGSPMSTFLAAQRQGAIAALAPSERQVRRNFRRLIN